MQITHEFLPFLEPPSLPQHFAGAAGDILKPKRETGVCAAYAMPSGEIRISRRVMPGAFLLAYGPEVRLQAEISRRAPRAFGTSAFTVPGTLWTTDAQAIRRAAIMFSWFLRRALASRFDAGRVA